MQQVIQLQPVTLADIKANLHLARSLVATFRTVFADEVWRESYTNEDVFTILGDEMSLPQSCCYVYQDQEGAVTAFTWGYVEQPKLLATRLIPDDQPDARQQFITRLHAPDGSPVPVLYVSQIGALREVRSFPLQRALFTSLLQFAAEQGAPIVIGRTSRHTSLYRTLLGLDMTVVYAYQAADGKDRVILAGAVGPLRTLFTTRSDAEIQAHIAHRLKEKEAK